MYFVYVLKSIKHDRRYVGLTRDIDSRLREHNSGKTRSTCFYKPWFLFYSETFETRVMARQREKVLKSGAGRQFLDKLVSPP